MNSLSFFEKFFISILVLKDIYSGYKILGWLFVLFQDVKM